MKFAVTALLLCTNALKGVSFHAIDKSEQGHSIHRRDQHVMQQRIVCTSLYRSAFGYFLKFLPPIYGMHSPLVDDKDYTAQKT